ncbi:unnamed protein product [Hermetia illucens]|uniref:BMP and activin membrane-bound inhibitor N-terminal domain-containing protein n=1 Tax=Hermetia illucens TaxID=343691 RepID=A0A7R8YWX7_HERIL|nr:uncharacterized protein LOC119655191 [Hermetia illucens]CAD7087830.1 unnamed protein product [Hermetia illucens]
MKALIMALCWMLSSQAMSSVVGTKRDDGSRPHGDIRCFCNLPQCITTSYVCRTERSGSNSGCFSEINNPINKAATRHGCVELLKKENRTLCDNVPQKETFRRNRDKDFEVLFLCCQDDMCNHVDSPANQKLTMELSDQKKGEETQHTGGETPENINLQNIPLLSSHGVTQNDAMFRVATIAVPIFGAVIFFVLIAVAIKILRGDRTSYVSSKLDTIGEVAGKLPLDQEAQGPKQYIHSNKINYNFSSDHCDKKNETRAKINMMNLEYSLLPQNCGSPNVNLDNTSLSNSNACYNINISLDTSNRNNLHKIYEKEVLSPLTSNININHKLKSNNV